MARCKRERDIAQHEAACQCDAHTLRGDQGIVPHATPPLSARRSRMIRYRKNGTPMIEVKTPTLMSLADGMMRTTISADINSALPVSALGTNSRVGSCPTNGRISCGATRPMKPMVPDTETAPPTQSEERRVGKECRPAARRGEWKEDKSKATHR